MIKAMQQQVGKAAGQVRQAFLGIVARFDAGKLQLKGLSDEVLQNVDLIQHVGFASGLPIEARVVVLPLQGKTGRAVVIASRGGPVVVTVEDGQTCIYDQFGHSILLSEGGIKMVGNVEVIGDFKAQKVSDDTSSMQDMRQTYNSHTHGNPPPPDQAME